MPRISVHGADLYYEIEGRGDWLVFAHGGDGNHLCWWRQVAALKDRFRCLTYDARGYGLSETGPSGTGQVRAPDDDLLAIMDHLGIDRAVLIGHSMGGMPVSGLAQSQAGRVRGLVMSDTPFGFATPALSRWAAEMIHKISNGFKVLDHLFAPGFAAAEPELHHLYTAICRISLGDGPPRPDGDQVYAPYIRMRDTPPIDYSTFSVPSLFIVGDQDELTLPWLVRATAEAVRGGEFRIIPGAGHSPFVEQTASYNTILTAFIDSL